MTKWKLWMRKNWRIIINSSDAGQIEIVNWEIMGRRFDIVCDEEGLFFENPKISSIDDKCNVMSVGNLVVCGEADDNGRLTSLSDEDVRHIMGSIKIVPTKFYPDGYRMICHVNP